MKKGMKCTINIVIILVLLIVGFLGYVSYRNDSESFLKLSAYNIITIFLALVVAFVFNQRKNDERKAKEKAEEIIEKIQAIVTSEEFCNITENTEENVLLLLGRTLNNKVELLLTCSEHIGLRDEISYVQKEIAGYRELIGNHINDLGYLAKSGLEIRRYSQNIDDKCDYIKISLY